MSTPEVPVRRIVINHPHSSTIIVGHADDVVINDPMSCHIAVGSLPTVPTWGEAP